MISTSSHENWQSAYFRTYAISGNRSKNINYHGESYPKLVPKLQFWKIWHDNIGVISDEENNRFYVKEYYEQVLSKLNPEQVYSELDYSVLLSEEEDIVRHIVAAWFEILLDVTVPEQKAKGSNVETIDRPGEIKKYLDEAMRRNRNMRGFKSLRALYLFERGEWLEAEADRLEQETGKCYDHYRQQACFFRCDADAAELEFNQRKLTKTIQGPSDNQ